jgi:hypothetical protein
VKKHDSLTKFRWSRTPLDDAREANHASCALLIERRMEELHGAEIHHQLAASIGGGGKNRKSGLVKMVGGGTRHPSTSIAALGKQVPARSESLNNLQATSGTPFSPSSSFAGPTIRQRRGISPLARQTPLQHHAFGGRRLSREPSEPMFAFPSNDHRHVHSVQNLEKHYLQRVESGDEPPASGDQPTLRARSQSNQRQPEVWLSDVAYDDQNPKNVQNPPSQQYSTEKICTNDNSGMVVRRKSNTTNANPSFYLANSFTNDHQNPQLVESWLSEQHRRKDSDSGFSEETNSPKYANGEERLGKLESTVFKKNPVIFYGTYKV